MDAAKPIDSAAATHSARAAEARAADLAQARRASSAARQSEAAQSRVRQADLAAETRDAIAQAIGANTRLAITRAQTAPIFIYQAIDSDTGEVVRQWPMQHFAELLNQIRPGAGDNLAGLVLDSEA